MGNYSKEIFFIKDLKISQKEIFFNKGFQD
jgi:hypothetical protein